MADKLQGGIKAGSTDVSLPVELRSSTNSTEATGKAHTDVTLSYWRQGGTRTAISAASLAAVDSAHSDGGWKEVDSTNMPGLYRLDMPDAAFATGADWVAISVKCSGCFTQNFMFALTTDVIQSGDSFARLGAPAGASLAADVAGVAAGVWAVGTRTLTAGTNIVLAKGTGITGFNDIAAADVWSVATRTLSSGANIVLAKGTGITGFNDIAAADVWSVATRTLTSGANIVLAKGTGVTGFNDIVAADVWGVATRTLTAGTNIVLAKGTGITGFNDLDSTAVQTAANAALEGLHLDRLLAAAYDPASKPGHASGLLNVLVENDGGVPRYTVNALENAPSGGGGGGDATAENQVTIINHLTDIKGASFSSATDSLEALRDRGDSAWITATGFSTHSAADVWSVATRTLSSGANIVLAKGVGITGLNDIAAADVWSVATRTLSSGANIVLAKGVGITGFNDIAAADVWSVATRTLTSGANIVLAKGTGVTGFNDIVAADVWGVATRTLTAGTNIVLAKGTGITGLNDLDSTAVQTAANAALVGLHLDHLLAAAYDPVSKPGHASGLFNVLVENDGGVPRYTVNALENAPSGGGGGATAEEIAEAVDVQLSATHGAGSWLTGSGSGGDGAYEITVHVVDEDDNPLENALVKVSDGITPHLRLTDADGDAVFALDAGTYRITGTKAGYDFEPEDRTVTGEETGTLTNDLVFVLVAIPDESADAAVCRVHGTIETAHNRPAAHVTLEWTLHEPDESPVRATRLLDLTTIEMTTDAQGRIVDADGNLYVEMQRNDLASPAGTYYLVNCDALNLLNHRVDLTDSLFNVADLVS